MLQLPVAKIFGVGSVTAKKMHDLNLRTCADLQRVSLIDLTKRFGKLGSRLYHLCRGEDERPVSNKRKRKSVSTERTFSADLPNMAACIPQLEALLVDLHSRLDRARCRHLIKARTLKLRFNGFATTTVTQAGHAIDADTYLDLLQRAWARGQKPVRLLGIGALLRDEGNPQQTKLFD